MWIIAASYQRATLEAVAIYKGGNEELRSRLPSKPQSMVDTVMEEAYIREEKVLFLCDGLPKAIRIDGQMVVFTSPGEKWLRAIEKHKSTLCIPPWTLLELHEGAFHLGLGEINEYNSAGLITDAVIQGRFNTFGGVARQCFHRRQDDADDETSEITTAINTTTTTKLLCKLMRGKGDSATCHRLLHYVLSDRKTSWTLELGSPFVKHNLAMRTLELTSNDRNNNTRF